MVAAAYLLRMLRDAGQDVSVCSPATRPTPVRKKPQEHVARLSDAIINQLAPFGGLTLPMET